MRVLIDRRRPKLQAFCFLCGGEQICVRDRTKGTHKAIRQVVVVAEFTEWLTASVWQSKQTAVPVGALRRGRLAARRPYVVVTGYIRFGRIDAQMLRCFPQFF